MLGVIAALSSALCFALAATIYRNPLLSTKAVSASIIRFSGTGAILLSITFFVWGFSPILSLPLDAIILAMMSGIIALAIGDVLYMTSFKTIGVARTVSVVATYPMFTLVLDFAISGTLIPFLAIIGTLLIFLGIRLITGEQVGEEPSSSPTNLRIGVIAGLMTAFLYSLSMILIDIALEAVPTHALDSAFAINAIRTASGGAVLLAGSPLIDKGFQFLRISRMNILLFLGGTLIAYGIGWYMLTLSFMFTPAALVVPLSSTTPMFATVISVVYLKEGLSRRSLIGILTTVFGVMLIVIV